MTELNPKQQVIEILRQSKRFLLLTHKNPDGDAIGSLVALYLTLRRLDKEVTMVCSDLSPASFSFISQINQIKQEFSGSRDFIISIDTKQVQASKVIYKIEGDRLNLIVTPKKGKFESNMVSFPQGGYNFDVIIVLDSADLDRLGAVYENNPDIFYEVPVVNIDHHPGNTQFGKINLLDITATSTSEILVSVIEALTGDSKFFDEDMATALLTGIITDTNSFQNTNTTPKSLTMAAQLVALGAKQQEIIKRIYKTKSLSTLKLWGRALSSLNQEVEAGFVWSALNQKDFSQTGALEEETTGLIDELLKTASGSDFALLLSEKKGDIHGSLRSINKTIDVSAIARLFDGGGHSMASAFQINNAKLSEQTDAIISKIVKFRVNKSNKPNA